MDFRIPNKNKQIKVLKKILSTPTNYKDTILVNDSFYSTFKMSDVKVNQILNALAAKDLIELIPARSSLPTPQIRVNQKAFAYIPDFRSERFRFFLPIIISFFALIGGYRQELAWLLQKVMQLLK